VDFSRELLERCTDDLTVVAVPPCGWSDLGTPTRLMRFLQQRQRQALRLSSTAALSEHRPALSWQ
jgi:hypothetical protein